MKLGKNQQVDNTVFAPFALVHRRDMQKVGIGASVITSAAISHFG